MAHRPGHNGVKALDEPGEEDGQDGDQPSWTGALYAALATPEEEEPSVRGLFARMDGE